MSSVLTVSPRLPLWRLWWAWLMALLAPAVAERKWLAYVFGIGTAPTSGVHYHWYTNNLTPASGTVVADFTEASGGSITPLTVANTSWTIATAAGVTTAVWTQQTVTVTGALTLYGYFVTDSTDTILLWAELFTGGPLVWGSGGGALLITPSITFQGHA